MEASVITNGIEKLTDKLYGWGVGAVEMLPNILIAVLIFVIFQEIGRWVYSILRGSFKKTDLNESLVHLLSNIGRVSVIALGFVLALSVLELQKAVFSLLAGVGVIGLALGFAFQDLAANFMSGIMLAVRSPIRIGDVIKIGDILGTVDDIRLRDTVIENFSGQKIFVPNKDFTSDRFTNYSLKGQRKLTINVGVGYEDDAKEAVDVVQKALSGVSLKIDDPAPTAYIEGLGGSSVDIIGHVWFTYPGTNFFEIRNEAYIAVKSALEEKGFNIPFPIRTLDIPDSTLQSLVTSSSNQSFKNNGRDTGKDSHDLQN